MGFIAIIPIYLRLITNLIPFNINNHPPLDDAVIDIIISVFLLDINLLSLIGFGAVLIVFILFITIREKELIKEKKQLNEEKELLQTLMDNIPDTIYFKDVNSRFRRINKAKAQETNLTNPDDAIGLSDFDFFSKDDAQEAYNDEQKIIKTAKPLINKVEKRKTIEGEEKWFSATKVPIFDNKTGKITGTVGITRDITKQIMAEKKLAEAKRKAEEADKLKSAFLANMSHEIRTPMNAILGFSELLNDNELTEEEHKAYLDYIKENGITLLKLIDDIIDISRIECNELEINKKDFQLHKLLNELYSFYKQENKRINNNKVKIILTKDPDYNDLYIHSDYIRLKQVFSNLIGNALKFTDSGKIEFGYEIVNNKHIRFFVRDTGIGIEKDKLTLIFERFEHIENKFHKNIAGTGLGLSISRHLVHLLGGEIWVDSEVGNGSTFYFTILDYQPKMISNS
jgi:PAS domain S-box-containing protein